MRINHTLLYMFITCIIALYSCKKDDKSLTADNATLTFNITGSQQYPVISQSRLRQVNPQAKPVIAGGTQVQLSMLAPSRTIQPGAAPASGTRANNTVSASTTSPLPAGIQYHILIYNSKGQSVGKILGTIGKAPQPLKISVGERYKWYAYSFGTENAMSAQTSIYTRTNADLLYASGEIPAASAGTNTTNIVFRHMLAAINVVINTRGMHAPLVPATQVFLSDMETAAFDVITGQFSNITPAKSASPATSKRINDVYKDTVEQATLYTIGSKPIPTVNCTISPTFIRDYPGSSGDSLYRFGKHSFTFDSLQPQVGQRTMLYVNFNQAGYVIGNTTWARGNLYYNYADKSFRFRHKEDYEYADKHYPWPHGITNITDNDINSKLWYNKDAKRIQYNKRPVEYFNANVKYPYIPRNWLYNSNEYINAAPLNYFPSANMLEDYQGDPCRLAYPYNTWRLPTRTEAEELLADMSTRNNKVLFTGSFGYLSYPSASPTDFFGNNFAFSANGMIFNTYKNGGNNKVNNEYGSYLRQTDLPDYIYSGKYTVAYNFSKTSQTEENIFSSARYWTSTPAPADDNDPNAKRFYSFYINFRWRDGITTRVPAGGYTDEATGTGIRPAAQHYGLNIRCVKIKS